MVRLLLPLSPHSPLFLLSLPVRHPGQLRLVFLCHVRTFCFV